MATTGYDPKKASTYNQLKQQGLSENQAREQAGISQTEKKHYMVNEVGSNDPKSASYNPNYGKMGPQVSGQNFQDYNKAVASGKTEEQAYAELQAKNTAATSDREFIQQEKAFLDEKQGKPATSDGSNQEEFDRAAYPINAKTPPNSKVVTETFKDTTTSSSGGGSVTRIAGQKVDTPASTAVQKQADVKQAELDKFYDDNPDPQERAQQGLPPLSPQEEAARKAQINQLSNEKTALENQATDLKASTPSSTIVRPNTTTSESTTTYEKTSENTPVNAPTGADPTVNQQAGTQLTNNYAPAGSINNTANDVVPGGGQITDPNAADYNADYAEFVRESQIDPPIQSAAPEPADNTYPNAGAGRGFVNPPVVQPDPQQIETFNEGQSTITTVTDLPAPVDAQTYETGGGGGNQGTITRVSYEPPPVDSETDLGVGPTGGNESTVNIGTDENRGGNLEAATLQRAREQQAIQAQFQAPADGDWRVRLKLAPSATYLYMDNNNTLLSPLKASNGVVFPYMPTISTSYNAEYSDTSLTHSNYKGYFYNHSNVGDVQISGIFTAQDTREATYLLAVIHFFRSVTKMFYGQDAQRGSPPPLVYLQGLGEYQFNNHPCVVKSFNYSLPNDVDYIRTKPNNYNINLNNRLAKTQVAPANSIASVVNRLRNALLPKGALPGLGSQELTVEQSVTNVANDTYVPTRIEISIVLAPIQTRNQQSQQFSVREFSNGRLLSGGFW